MKKYICIICGYVYDPAAGDPDSGIAPGTAFEDIPSDWVCPLCGVGKEDFKARTEDTIDHRAYAQGYAEGKEFDPAHRLGEGAAV